MISRSTDQTGGIEAFREIVERYHNAVCAVAYSATGDRVLSEDVGQETFLVAWHQLSSLRDPDRLGAWLCGIARNLGRKAVRRRKYETVADVHAMDSRDERDPGPLQVVLDREVEAVVWQALEKLPPRYREPLVLFYREEQSVAEVARSLGLSEQVAKQRLSRGRRSLREGIDELAGPTLAAGRPRKGFTAAVLAALAASVGGAASASAAGAASASAGTTLRAGAWRLAVVLVAVGATGVTVLALGSDDSISAKSTALHGEQQVILAQLRRQHDAVQTAARGQEACRVGGTVTGAGGALVAVVDVASTALDPVFVETDERGAWQLGPRPAGEHMVSVTAPGRRAEARVVRCAGGRVAEERFSLEPGGALVRGEVSDIGGGPVAGVTVWVLGDQGPLVAQAFAGRTGADGVYELRVPRGLYTVLMVHPEYAMDARPIALGDSPAREDFTLVPGGSIEGTVASAETGRPIPGARVTTSGPSFGSHTPTQWQMASLYGAMVPVIADDEGRFRLRGLPPGGVGLVARSTDFASASPVEVDLALAEERAGVSLALGGARTIAGFVVRRGDEGRGLAGVRVVAQREGAPLGALAAASDASGHFVIDGAIPGRYRLMAVGRSSPPLVLGRAVTVVDRDVDDQLLVVERGAAVRGRVEPPGPISIRLEPASPGGTEAAIAASLTLAEVDKSGSFELPAVAPGDYLIKATSYDRHGQLPVTVSSTDRTGLVIRLEPRPAIVGQVFRENGEPLVGAVVEARPPRPSARATPGMAHTTARTDETGRFHLVGIDAGRHEVRVFDGIGQRPSAGGSDQDPFAPVIVDVPASGPVAARLEVKGGGKRLTGTVVGPDGAPVADAWIKVHARGADRVPTFHGGPPVLTDASGRFSIDGVFGDELELDATGPRGDLRAAVGRVRPGQKIELRPVAALRARVSFEGRPAPEFRVLVRQAERGARGELVETKRGQNGEVELAELIAGPYEIEVSSPLGYAVRTIVAGPGSTSVDLHLARWASVRGRLVGRDSRPLAGVTVMTAGGGSSLLGAMGGDLPGSAVTGADGGFAIQRLTAGRREVRILEPPLRLEVDLAEGQDLDVGAVNPERAPEQTTRSASEDLGLRFFLGAAPPSRAELTAIDRDPALAYRDRDEPGAQLWIASVGSGSPAEAAGLRAGDRVVAVGQRAIGSGSSASAAMMSLSLRWRSTGRRVDWVVMRGERELRLAVTVQGKAIAE
jgi:RNA polymerase sigma factor (sigma-70 family)